MDFEKELRLVSCEPAEWFVVFHRTPSRWWVKWLAMGKYTHVSAFGQVAESGIWLFFDVLTSRARFLAISDAQADKFMAVLVNEGTIVKMPAPSADDSPIRLKPGLWCVPAVAHLLGLRTCALRPDALLRHCLANGGEIVVSDVDEDARGRSRTESAGSAGFG